MDESEKILFSAQLPVNGIARPPGDAPRTRVRDVLLLTGDRAADNGDTSKLIMLPKWEHENPFDNGGWTQPSPIHLCEDLSIVKLERDESELVLNACSPRGHFFDPVRQFGQMYSFEREIDPAGDHAQRYEWDADHLIFDAVAMSRLILDNGYSGEYAARIVDFEDGQKQVIPFSGQPTYRLNNTRDWFHESEAEALGKLLSGFRRTSKELPERVSNALWMAEYTTSVRWLDVISPLLVVGFESLVNTGKEMVSRQFRERVASITDAAGSPLTQEQCRRLYGDRSTWVHGKRVSGYKKPRSKGEHMRGPSDAEQRDLVAETAVMQAALRGVLALCIQDQDFCAHFSDVDSVRRKWPVSI